MNNVPENAMRPVCRAVHEAIGLLPTGAFNFGLYFQKWFYVKGGSSEEPYKCPTDLAKKGREPGLTLLDNLPVSIELFNTGQVTAFGTRAVWDKAAAERALERKHRLQEEAIAAFRSLGYDCIRQEAALQTPLVIGLGNEHPTEKGFRFDWTSGVPAIPASSIKGVVRLAFLVNEMNRLYDDEGAAKKFGEEVRVGSLSELSTGVFGTGGERVSQRGGVIFLDAYPLAMPKLKAEIMTCHYADYYQGSRGPTEDQQPNPQKFWAIDPLLDGKGARARFAFRMLINRDLSRNPLFKQELLVEAVRSALEEHGLGAKTAIGHGRFMLESGDESPEAQQTLSLKASDAKLRMHRAAKPPSSAIQTVVETWEEALLTWDPGSRMLIATWQGKKATCLEADVLPEPLKDTLTAKKKKRKPVRVTVMVEEVGNAFKIIKVEP